MARPRPKPDRPRAFVFLHILAVHHLPGNRCFSGMAEVNHRDIRTWWSDRPNGKLVLTGIAIPQERLTSDPEPDESSKSPLKTDRILLSNLNTFFAGEGLIIV
jgi:hypothetical protein